MIICLRDDTVTLPLDEGKVNLTCYDESVPAMAQMGAEVLISKNKCIILKDSRKLTFGHIVDKEPIMRQWHCRYGQLNCYVI